MNVGVSYTFLKNTSAICDYLLFQTNISFPTGESPYDVIWGEELSTGSGLYSATFTLNTTKTLSPFSIYGSIAYTHRLDLKNINQKLDSGVLDEVEPGGTASMKVGSQYHLSDNRKLYINYKFGYTSSYKYYYKNAPSAEGGDSYVYNDLRLGMKWLLENSHTFDLSAGFGLSKKAGLFSIRYLF